MTASATWSRQAVPKSETITVRHGAPAIGDTATDVAMHDPARGLVRSKPVLMNAWKVP
jgi:hypothetical protein